MWPGNQADSYAHTGVFGSLCSTMTSCLGLLCCCWLFRDCLGHQREPTTPLMAPPPGPVDDRRDPQSSFRSGPPGPMDDHLAQLGGPHSPFGVPTPPSHNPFGTSNPPGPPGPLDDRLAHLRSTRNPFGVSDAPRPPGLHRPPIQHHYTHEPPHIQHGYPHGLLAPPEPPRVPGVQPGLL